MTYAAVSPPSTRNVAPFTYEDSSLARKSAPFTISRLPEREKLVITLYYYEELTLREIGEVLGVTESRVSQLHTKAVIGMRAHLQTAAA